MKSKNNKFFIRLKDAIFNFDEYKNFAYEKSSIAIVFLVKLLIMFSVIVSLAICIKAVQIKNIVSNELANNYPDFKFENSTLTIENESNRFVKDYKNDYRLIIDTNVSNIEEIEEANSDLNLVVLLKDKVVFKDSTGTQNSAFYEEFANEINTSKQGIVDFLNSNSFITALITIYVFIVFFMFIALALQAIINIFMLYLIGIILSFITRIRMPFEKILNICIYSITLSVVLSIIYKVSYIFTGFEIIYFDIAYKAIAYVYLITALLIIKSDLIKQNIEVQRMIKVQKQVKEEFEKKKEEEKQRKKERQEDKQEENKEVKKQKNKKEKNGEQQPEGNQA